jgi:hypothetical protein
VVQLRRPIGRESRRMIRFANDRLARAVADHVPDGGDFGKLDCLDAIELHLLRPAAAELRKAFDKACGPSA